MTRRTLREHCFKMLFCTDFYPPEEAGEQTGTDVRQSEENGIPETETESDVSLPHTDPQLLAQNADILAQTLIRVMKAE